MNIDRATATLNYLRSRAAERTEGSQQRVVGGIIIPERPPASIVEALNNFVAAVLAYDESGVWPDNGTIRRLAEEGREALGHRYSPNAGTQPPPG